MEEEERARLNEAAEALMTAGDEEGAAELVEKMGMLLGEEGAGASLRRVREAGVEVKQRPADSSEKLGLELWGEEEEEEERGICFSHFSSRWCSCNGTHGERECVFC